MAALQVDDRRTMAHLAGANLVAGVGQTLGFRRVQSATGPIGCHIGPSPGGRMTNNRPENVSNPSDLG
ncbi:hypothetical protein, partial [Mesorhizobium sp. M1E.F.Ca.ET.041.01.1.1]|uniref:hypothetical protein n=1 Tax=Mesorhizobium sp. M1E.F.Ca.ET.041.01.1.1 TaxID=2496759 RepID=UPI001AECC7F1